jgi:hypothetical protein
MRFVRHILGWFWKGFGFIQSPRVLGAGIGLTTCAIIAYFRFGREAIDQRFWGFHGPWLLVDIAIVFIALPGDQRYYLMVFPPLLVIMLRGFLGFPKPWKLSAICVPALLLYILVPLAIENHRDEAPAVRFVRFFEKLYPPSKRGNVLLILPVVSRSAQWYAPQFKILDHVPISPEEEEMLRNAAAVYTDDLSLKLKDFYLIELADFRRSMLIYPQNRHVRLYLLEPRRSEMH